MAKDYKNILASLLRTSTQRCSVETVAELMPRASDADLLAYALPLRICYSRQ